MKNLYINFKEMLEKLDSISLLLLRVALAYGFWGPAMMKWGNMSGIAEWFASMGYPLPTLNAYLAGTTELAGAVLLLLGLGTRVIAIPLMFVMMVAIFTVHIGNGFEAGNNGFEIPLYYFLMLFVLLAYGGGKFSLDHLLAGKLHGSK